MPTRCWQGFFFFSFSLPRHFLHANVLCYMTCGHWPNYFKLLKKVYFRAIGASLSANVSFAKKNILAALSNALSLRRFIPGGVDSDRSTSFKRERAGHKYHSKWTRNTPHYLHQKAPRLLFRPHIGENRTPRHLFLLKSIRHRRKTVSMDMASAVKQ